MNVIRRAMANLPGHWYKGNITDGNGNFCGLGHIHRARLDAFDPRRSAVYFLEEVAKEQYPDRVTLKTTGDSIFANFNDHPDTTEEDVLRVMEKAAIKMEESV